MTLDLHSIVTGLLGIVCGILGWLGREVWGAVQKLRADLSTLEVKLGTDYVRYDRMQDLLKPVMQKLDRIEDALARKADRDDPRL